MRRSTLLVVALCAAGVLVCGAAGLAVATDTDATFDGGGLRMAAQATTRVSPSTSAQPTISHPLVVTVPNLPTTEAPPVAPPAVPAEQSAVPAAPPPPPAPTPAPSDPAPSEPAPPPDAPVNPPYSTILGWHGDGKVAYLTFDDGPGPYTGRVLDVLAAAGVKATFCEVGQKVSESPGLTQRVVAEGHTLCNHSWDHYSPFDTLPAQTLDQEIGLTQNAFLQATGVTVRYFRAPEGRFGDPGGAVLQAGQRARTIPLAWGVDSLDWKKPGAPAIVSTVLTTVSPGAIVLLHDGGGADREETLAALPGVISGLQSAGYTLAALPPDPAG
jgi:peptidoglycan/xylan/chitin deacetylase (PgdA/CDA1 family)